MAQTAKKTAASAASKAAKTAKAAVASTRNQAENVVNMGQKAAKGFVATSTAEAHKAQEKAYAIATEGAEKISKAADTITKSLYEAVAQSRDNVETAIEIGNLTASMSKDVGSEVYEFATKAFSDNVELSKEIFAVRTLNDFVELQNKVVQSSLDGFFNQSTKLYSILFEYGTEAMEPINERVSQATDTFNKKLKAVK